MQYNVCGILGFRVSEFQNSFRPTVLLILHDPIEYRLPITQIEVEVEIQIEIPKEGRYQISTLLSNIYLAFHFYLYLDNQQWLFHNHHLRACEGTISFQPHHIDPRRKD